MKKHLLFVLTFILCVGIFIPQAQASFLSNLFSMPTYTLSGKIVDRNQEPLVGALVSFSSNGVGGKYSVRTDESGNYILHLPSKTGGQLVISMEGYRTKKDTFGSMTSEGKNYVLNYDLRLDSITGKVVNVGEEPLEGVKITFECDGGLNGIKTVYTDENGNYKVQIPKDGVGYWITFSLDGYNTIRLRETLYGGNFYNATMR